MFKKFFLVVNSIFVASASTAGAGDEHESIHDLAGVFDDNAYHLQKDICSRFLELEKLQSLSPQQIFDLSLLESLLQNITAAPMTYC